MSETAGTSSNVSSRPVRSRKPSARKCCACCVPQPSIVGRRRTSVQADTDDAHVDRPRRSKSDVVPSASKAKSSVQQQPGAVKRKPKKAAAVSAVNSAVPEQEGASLAQETGGAFKKKPKKAAAVSAVNSAVLEQEAASLAQETGGAVKKKPRKAAAVSAVNSAVPEQEADRLTQETARDVKEVAQVNDTPKIRKQPVVPLKAKTSETRPVLTDVKEVAQVNHTPKIRKQPAVPPKDKTSVKTANPRQEKADLTRSRVDEATPSTSKSKKPPIPKQVVAKKPQQQPPQPSHHITWDGFNEIKSVLEHICCFCEGDLAVAPEGHYNETEYSKTPVVAMLSCGHVFHASCLDEADFSDFQGDPPCVICESTMC